MFARGIRPLMCIILMTGCGKADLAGSNRSANGSPQPTGTSAPPVASPLEGTGSASNPNNQGDTNKTNPSACVVKLHDDAADTTVEGTTSEQTSAKKENSTTEHTSKIEKKSKSRKEIESENGQVEEKSREKSKDEYEVKKESVSDENHNHDDEEDDDEASNCQDVSDKSKT